MRDLAPHIHRQRLVTEATPAAAITAGEITEHLSKLSVELDLVDIYTCEAFSAEAAVRFADTFFAASDIVVKEF